MLEDKVGAENEFGLKELGWLGALHTEYYSFALCLTELLGDEVVEVEHCIQAVGANVHE